MVGARATTLGAITKNDPTLKGLLRVEPLQGYWVMLMKDPKVVASSNLGLKLANALGVIDHRVAYEERKLEFIAVTENGELATPLPSAPPMVAEIVSASARLYRDVGYEPPWIGYLAVEDGTCVGTCGFKSPPQNNRVEIAYFTFPGHESRGVATRMASELIRLARAKMPAVIVAAQTLPEENASTSILKKLGFRLVGTVEHPEDGPVWEWQLEPAE